jgi:indole-3-glycerol phosphate synthase
MGFLTDLAADVRRGLRERPLDDSALLSRAMSMPPARDFAGALRARTPAVIAEVKRASPSAGTIADADPAMQARVYESAGAAAVSVLTEPRHFYGSLADLRAVHRAVEVPVLRKDFLLHPSQVIESRAAGADAVLLISSCLSPDELTAMLGAAADLGIGVIVEAHGEDDLERALASGAPIVGVNARDLETLDVDRDRARRLLRQIPPDRVAVLESGVASRADVEAAVQAGAAAVLVGEALMRAHDPGATLRELLGEEARG